MNRLNKHYSKSNLEKPTEMSANEYNRSIN